MSKAVFHLARFIVRTWKLFLLAAMLPTSAVAQDSEIISPEDDMAAIIEAGCIRGSARGCFLIAESYRRGQGVEKDMAKAAALYELGCDGGYAKACTNLGMHYDFGEGVAKDQAKAAALYGRACDGGDAIGCYNLGALYTDGEGVEMDHEKAKTYMRRALAIDPANAKAKQQLNMLEGN